MICKHQARLCTTRELTQRAAVDEVAHEVLSQELDTFFFGIQYLRNEGDEELAQDLAEAVDEHIIQRSPKSVHKRAAQLEKERGYI